MASVEPHVQRKGLVLRLVLHELDAPIDNQFGFVPQAAVGLLLVIGISSNRLEYVSRVPTYKEPVAQFATKQHHAVIYVVSQGFGRPFRSYHIAVFDKTGKRLATHSLANAGRSYLTASTINENLEAVCSMYQVNWASDVDEVSLEENSITGLTLERSENIDLTKPSEDDFNLQKLKLKQPEKKEEKVKTIGAVFN